MLCEDVAASEPVARGAKQAIKLHGFAPSTTTQIALIAALESGCEVQLQNVVLFQGDHKAPAYLAMNSFGRIPMLEDPNNNDFKLTESRAIMKYFALKYAAPGTLVPATVEERVQMERFVSLEFSYVSPALGKVFGQVVPAYLGLSTLAGVDESSIAAGVQSADLATALKELEQSLAAAAAKLPAGSPVWLLGRNFTLADVVFVTFFHYFNLSVQLFPQLFDKYPESGFLTDSAKLPHFVKWWAAIQQRPSVQLVLAEGTKAFDIVKANSTRGEADKLPHPKVISYKL